MKTLIQSLCLVLCQLLQFATGAQAPVLNSYPSANAVIFLDFDGHTVDGTSWNWRGSPIVCAASGLNTEQVTQVYNRVAEDYRPFNINITTDPTKFIAAPVDKRMRVIITPTSGWYGNTASGVAFIGSFTSGDDTPCFVFSGILRYDIKKITETISHESGHTLGLYHQSKYDSNCNKITEYYAGQGTGEIGWAPIMGTGFNRNFTLWGNGPNSLGCTNYQSDLDIISSSQNGFGYRADDHDNEFDKATAALFFNNQFEVKGIIEQNIDSDLFRFTMPGRGRFHLNAIPYNAGPGNAGSNLDLQISLYNGSQALMNIYNPDAFLNSFADTILTAGNYYLKAEGKGNVYAPAYASLGSYSLNAIIKTGILLAMPKLKLNGFQNGGIHKFNWIIEADEEIVQQILEVSIDGKEFIPLKESIQSISSYNYQPAISTNKQYRLMAMLNNGQRYFSNIVSLKKNDTDQRPILLNNLISSNTVIVSSRGNYNYSIIDFNGKTIISGRLLNGINNINAGMITGMYVIRFTNIDQQWTDKLLRQ